MASTPPLDDAPGHLKYKKCIVGCDYGCTSTAFAYSMVDHRGFHETRLVNHWDEIADPTNVPLHEEPGTYTNNKESKVPTRVAYGRDNGREEDRFANQVEDADMSHCLSKLDLEGFPALGTMKVDTDEKRLVAGLDADGFTAFQRIVVDYLAFCYPRVLARIKQMEHKDLDGVTIVWVFTYPSTWNDERFDAFKSMVKFADFASRDTDELEFLPEPDAAAYHCLTQQPTGILENGTALVGHGAASVGNGVALVADLGGGTVDVSTFRIANPSPLKLAKVLEDKGIAQGSCFVDKSFLIWMEISFGSAFTALPFADRGPSSQFMKEFEAAKRAFDGDQSKFYEVTLKMDTKINNLYWEGKVQLSSADMASFFKDSIKAIIKLLEEQANLVEQTSRKITMLYVVGGYAQNKYLYSQLSGWARSRKAGIYCFQSANLCTVKGSVLSAREKVEIKTNAVHYSYGCSTPGGSITWLIHKGSVFEGGIIARQTFTYRFDTDLGVCRRSVQL